MMRKAPRPMLAFTLVELLVVIAIVSVLAAIVFPVYSKARRNAEQTSCISNLRQIGTAMNLYMTDYDDRYPFMIDAADKYRPEIWGHEPEFQAQIPIMPMMQEALDPYSGSQEIFRSPRDTGTEVLDTHPYMAFPTSPTMYDAYGTSYMFRTEIAFRRMTQTAMAQPSAINVIMTGAGHWYGSEGPLRQNEYQENLKRRQGFRYNVLMGDFRVESMSFGQLQQAWFSEL